MVPSHFCISVSSSCNNLYLPSRRQELVGLAPPVSNGSVMFLVHHAWCCNKILVSFAFPPSQRSCAARNLCSKLFSYGLCLSNKTGALTLKF